MNPPINVFILTYCRNLEQFYGTELIFKTLRTGFPNARVRVVDNASVPEARAEVARLAKATDCAFETLASPGIEHHAFIENAVRESAHAHASGSAAVFLDPDVCLWRNCEDLLFDRPVAGMMVEAHNDDVMQCVTMARLHTSFLWISDAAAVMKRIESLRRMHVDFRPFMPFSVKLGDVWLRYDTGASLYAAMPDACACFTDEHADYYDHLYAGSHLDLWNAVDSGDHGILLRQTHQWAKNGDLRALRGIWRRQAEVWSHHARPVRQPEESRGGE